MTVSPLTGLPHLDQAYLPTSDRLLEEKSLPSSVVGRIK